MLHAKQIALQTGGQITAVHILPFAESSFDLLSTNRRSDIGLDDGRSLLESLFTAEELEQVNFKLVVLHGNLTDTLLAYVRKESPDVLVLASKSSEGLRAKLFGTRTGKIIDKVSCPILVIPPKARMKHLKHCVIGTNFERHGNSLGKLFKFFDLMRSNVSFLHIKHEEKRSFSQRMWDFKLWLKAEFNIESIDVHSLRAKTILEGLHLFSQKNEIDCLALIQKKRKSFDEFFTISVSQKIAFDGNIPILILKA